MGIRTLMAKTMRYPVSNGRGSRVSDILIGLAKGLKPYMGFVGTLLGALITMVSTGLADRRQDKRERRQFKEQEYLGVVDNVHAIKEGLRKIKANSVDQLYSRVNGSREDSEALDRRGAQLVEELFRSIREFDLRGDRLRVYAPRLVIDAYAKMSESLWKYLETVGESTRIDGRIRHADYVNELDLLRNQLDDFLTAIRKDLGYGRQ